MADGKKIKYLTKSVSFAGKEITLYSLDGLTWSTRRSELLAIKERQERDKVSFAALKEENGETQVVPRDTEEPEEDEAFSNPEFGNEEVYEDDLRAERQKEIDAEGDAPPRRGRRPRMFPDKPGEKPAKPVVAAKESVKAAASSKKPLKNPAASTPSKGKVSHAATKSKGKVTPKKRESSKPVISKQGSKSKAKSKKKAA